LQHFTPKRIIDNEEKKLFVIHYQSKSTIFFSVASPHNDRI
jgi:hypothetical protein